jgi:hypothetical protein
MRRKLMILFVLMGMMTVGIMLVSSQDRGPKWAVRQTVLDFYKEYADTAGYDPATDLVNNPLLEGTYRKSEYLTQTLIDRIDAIRESGAPEIGLHCDPLLCIQDIPQCFSVDVVEVTDLEATVLLREYLTLNPRTHNITVKLVVEDDLWKINEIICQDTTTPEGVVATFYEDYLAVARPEEGMNPLTDGYYRDHELLTNDLLTRVETMDQDGLQYDLFLPVQDIPNSVDVYAAGQEADQARVIVDMYFGDSALPHSVLVNLKLLEGQWQIDAIVSEVGPAAVTELVYTQYGLYRWCGLMNQVSWVCFTDWDYPWERYLVEELIEFYADYATESLRYDTFLCGRGIPDYFSAKVDEQSEESATVIVIGHYGPNPSTDAFVSKVNLLKTEDGWLLNDVSCQ